MKAIIRFKVLKSFFAVRTGVAILFFVVFLITNGANAGVIIAKSGNYHRDSIIKILAIGNSFSEDAVENNLYNLAKAGGYKVIIGNLVIGGASLDLHWDNAAADKAVYSYRKIGLDGKKVVRPKVSISSGITDENWDFISLQQVSHKSGMFDAYIEPLPLLFKYVKEHATNPKLKMMWQQTWAYAQNSKHNGFSNYNNDQSVMYDAIVSSSMKVMKLEPFDILIPSGTAIQNARKKMGDVLCRDGFHLNLNYGRFTVSCVWYEAIFGKKVTENAYLPDKVNKEEAIIAKKSAHAAVKKPFKVTNIK